MPLKHISRPVYGAPHCSIPRTCAVFEGTLLSIGRCTQAKRTSCSLAALATGDFLWCPLLIGPYDGSSFFDAYFSATSGWYKRMLQWRENSRSKLDAVEEAVQLTCATVPLNYLLRSSPEHSSGHSLSHARTHAARSVRLARAGLQVEFRLSSFRPLHSLLLSNVNLCSHSCQLLAVWIFV